jgi:hypothetical protein
MQDHIHTADFYLISIVGPSIGRRLFMRPSQASALSYAEPFFRPCAWEAAQDDIMAGRSVSTSRDDHEFLTIRHIINNRSTSLN